MSNLVISVTRTDTKVVVVVNSKIKTETPFYHLTWDAGTINHAELLRQQLASVIEEEVRTIREQAYLAGYKDGRAKKAKRTWFSSWFRRDD